MKCTTAQLKNGLKLILDGNPCSVIHHAFVKPGKGQAFTRVKFKDLISGRTLEKTFKSGESLEIADIMEFSMQYLYKDADSWCFMNLDNYDQYNINEKAISDSIGYLVEQEKYLITLWNDNPIVVTAPSHVILEVSATEPGVKGDTAGAGTKPATLNTGIVLQVPLFIAIGDKIKVDTRSNEYSGRG